MFRDFSLRARRLSRNKQFDYVDGQNLVPNINDLLSPELLLKIFSYLSDRNEISLRVLPVCMLWYKIGNDGSLWKSLEFTQQTISIQKRVMEKIKLKGRLLVFRRALLLKKTPYQIVTLFLHFFGIGISIFFLSQTNKILCNESKISRLILKIYYNIRLSWKTLKTSRFLPFFDKIDIFFYVFVLF